VAPSSNIQFAGGCSTELLFADRLSTMRLSFATWLLDYVVASCRLPVTVSNELMNLSKAIIERDGNCAVIYLLIRVVEAISRREPTGFHTCIVHLLVDS
jgi:hypothetical protein